MILVDTSVWIDFFKKTNNKQTQILKDYLNRGRIVYLPVYVYVEILQGIKDDKTFRLFEEYLNGLQILKLKDMNSYRSAIEIYRTCRKAGKTIRRTIDLFIVQIAMENKIPLLQNDRDYRVVSGFCPGLVLI